jgi:hypothetical protein
LKNAYAVKPAINKPIATGKVPSGRGVLAPD